MDSFSVGQVECSVKKVGRIVYLRQSFIILISNISIK